MNYNDNSPSELFHFERLTSYLLGDVADVVGSNNNKSCRFAENLIKSWRSDGNFYVQLAFLRKDLQRKYKI